MSCVGAVAVVELDAILEHRDVRLEADLLLAAPAAHIDDDVTRLMTARKTAGSSARKSGSFSIPGTFSASARVIVHV